MTMAMNVRLRTFATLDFHSSQGIAASVSSLSKRKPILTDNLTTYFFSSRLNFSKIVHTFLSLSLAAVAGFRGGGSEVVRSRSDRSSHVCPGRRLGPPASEHEVEHCTALHSTGSR